MEKLLKQRYKKIFAAAALVCLFLMSGCSNSLWNAITRRSQL